MAYKNLEKWTEFVRQFMYLYNETNYENKQIKQCPYIFDTPSKSGDLTLKIECYLFLTPNYELCNRFFTELRSYFLMHLLT